MLFPEIVSESLYHHTYTTRDNMSSQIKERTSGSYKVTDYFKRKRRKALRNKRKLIKSGKKNQEDSFLKKRYM